METFNNIFFIIFSLTLTFLRLEALHENCKKTYCNPGGPSIQFPFQLKSSQEHQNSYGEPGFVLDCENNSTIINFPSYGNLVVKSISYKTRKLDLLDPRSCVHGVFLNLNLSLTPFHYYYTLKDYTYLNCSARLSSNSFTEIPCLSGVGHHVYTVEPSLDVPFSCQPIKTIAIPFGYSSSLSDNSFGLRLTWGSLGREDCEGKGIRCALQSKNGGLIEEVRVLWIIGIFAAAALISRKIYWSEKTDSQKEERYQVGHGKILGDYTALKVEIFNADVDTEQPHKPSLNL
ncbi:uncharacterized protein LOC107430320 [Ziziphus jujuba]|uniref:RING-type E3 ubiquitin transferase n=2 Tax=Ziziphus jujuba TaxID=326968 RepID=A0A6P4BCF8_ZIZJJ|nr:uncharacterized protein LOC107430320 [Ziziphus jujuba]KAH7514221.1 hypothetical protein FEM48_Zijuj11G0065800 [Ziziphus jujuba var. spinosa]